MIYFELVNIVFVLFSALSYYNKPDFVNLLILVSLSIGVVNPLLYSPYDAVADLVQIILLSIAFILMYRSFKRRKIIEKTEE